jgi:hypothetical protein
MGALASNVSPAHMGRTVIPQLVPSSTCLRCDVCCRFPDPDSPLRPYFTGEEITAATDAGNLEPRLFPLPAGSQVSLVPDERGEGYLCPAFDPETARCRIYEQRPLDCRIYPFVLMWNASHDQVVLGWDRKCPFMPEQLPSVICEHADRVIGQVSRPELVDRISRHPRLIGEFQDDVVTLAPLPQLTLALRARWGDVPVHRLTIEDVPRLQAGLDRAGLCEPRSPAAYAPAYHYMGNVLMTYWWAVLEEALCLFIESPDGWFMPLPPLTNGSLAAPLAAAFRFMRQRNGDSPVSRVENVSASLASRLTPVGYQLRPKDPDYLYRAEALASLAGDRFKAQRALCNRVERRNEVVVEPYSSADRKQCRELFNAWQRQKQVGDLEPVGRLLLEDAAPGHEVVWAHAPALRLAGTVVRIDGRIRAYTFGYWLTGSTWCVLLEVADRTVPGLAQYLFRHVCREAMAQGAEFINTMDDAGLGGLRSSKQAYRPIALIQNFVLSEAPCA